MGVGWGCESGRERAWVCLAGLRLEIKRNREVYRYQLEEIYFFALPVLKIIRSTTNGIPASVFVT
jgi:hypothetical protein